MKKLNALTVYLIYNGGFAFFFRLVTTVSLIYQVTVVGLNPLQLVLVGTALELSAALFEIPTGVVADLYGRKRSVIIGTALTGVAFIIEGSFPVWGMVMLAQVVWGIGWTFISGALDAWIADEIGTEQAGRAYLRASQVGQVAGLAAILPGVLLGSVALALPIVLGGALFLGLAAFLLLFMPEEGFKPASPSELNSWGKLGATLRDGLRLVRARPVLLTLLLVELFYGAYSEGADRLWTPFLLEAHTLPLAGQVEPVVWFGAIEAVSSLLAIGATELVRRRLDLTDGRSLGRAMTAFYGLVALGTLLFALSDSLGMALAALWLMRTARNTAGPVYIAWMNQHLEPEVRATVLSMAAQANEVGQIAGGPILGAVGTASSLRVALTLSGLLMLPAVGLLARRARGPVAAAVATD